MIFFVDSMRKTHEPAGKVIIRALAAGGEDIGYVEWKQSTSQIQPKIGQKVEIVWDKE